MFVDTVPKIFRLEQGYAGYHKDRRISDIEIFVPRAGQFDTHS
jgi:hypothetical protein